MIRSMILVLDLIFEPELQLLKRNFGAILGAVKFEPIFSVNS